MRAHVRDERSLDYKSMLPAARVLIESGIELEPSTGPEMLKNQAGAKNTMAAQPQSRPGTPRLMS